MNQYKGKCSLGINGLYLKKKESQSIGSMGVKYEYAVCQNYYEEVKTAPNYCDNKHCLHFEDYRCKRDNVYIDTRLMVRGTTPEYVPACTGYSKRKTGRINLGNYTFSDSEPDVSFR